MQKIADFARDAARSLTGVLFDLDDTLLDSGRLSEAAYGSLFRLRESGLILLAVTGRPSGWGEILALQWPVQGFVTENGSVAIVNDEGIRTLDEVEPAIRNERRERLLVLTDTIMTEFPALVPSRDVALRRSDFTFDVGEFHQVPNALVIEAMAFAKRLGAMTIRSSVHLHVSFDGSDKASGTLRVLNRQFGFDVTDARRTFAFIGDSENDESCFAAFGHSVAVANLRGRPTIAPRYVTRSERGSGFAEFAEQLVALRR